MEYVFSFRPFLLYIEDGIIIQPPNFTLIGVYIEYGFKVKRSGCF